MPQWVCMYKSPFVLGMLYSYRRGVSRCSFLTAGQSQGLTSWNGQHRSPRLNRNAKHNTLIVRYKTMGILWIDTIKFPLFLFSQDVIYYRCARFLVGKSKKNRVTDKESKDFAYLCINLNDWGTF